MPYHVGDKGSNGCSGYSVVSDTGKVMGCHPTKSNAQEQVAALYASGAADKADTPMDVSNNPIMTDPEPASPSSHINPSVGMKKPQYGYNFGRTVGGGIHDKRVVEIWRVKKDEVVTDNPILPTPTYQHCECDTCIEQNITCSNCPDCQNGMDSEMEMAEYDASVGKTDCCPNELEKQAPCWKGYVQRGTKPGKDGKPVPNCVPAAKAPIADLGKDYTKSTTNTYRMDN